MKLPECVKARRIGYWMESEYDMNGELAPITWFCNCGARLTLERWADEECLNYIPIPQVRKDQFIAEHSNCKA